MTYALVCGIWHCYAGDWRQTRVVGLGYDPEMAFSDWWAMTRRKWTTEVGAVPLRNL